MGRVCVAMRNGVEHASRLTHGCDDNHASSDSQTITLVGKES
jgi:hypothetical protein